MPADAASSPSPFVTGIAPITATDAEISAALAEAELPPLLPALAYLTGDLGLLREHLRPDPLLAAMPQGGLTDAQQAEIRALALATITAYRDGGCRPAPAPADDELIKILEFTVGGAAMDAYLPLLEEEMAYRGEDRRAPQWTLAEVAPGRSMHVLIIGAGMSGILAAHRLAQAGVSYEIIEKNDDLAGTWLVNTYPGCRVDNPNHNYSYSFAQRHDWPFHFSTQDVLREYFQDCARAFGVDQHVVLRTEVISATWLEADAAWDVLVRHADGTTETKRADAVISAVGQLSRPKLPDIEGRDTFAGEWFHSAVWNDAVEFGAKRVACIGTGASALQFLPIIAPECGTLTIYQRTPGWLAPTPEYHEPVPSGLKWLYGHVPGYSELNRFAIFWRMGDGALETVRVEDDFPHRPDAVGAVNDFAREMLTEYLRESFADRPDLLEQVTPKYPLGAKRGIRDNGAWPQTLKRDNVRLVTDGIARIEPNGIRTVSGELIEADVLIYGSGFEASKFLEPITVTGRDGADLHEQWDGDARAYLGVAIPGFPNFFCLYGPNTNIVLNGSIIYFSECGTRLILGLLELLARSGSRSIEVRRDVHDDFNAASDAANLKWSWGWSDVSSWYKNEKGRSATNWAFTLLEYWQRTLAPEPEEFVLES